jgi:hypothetical protein
MWVLCQIALAFLFLFNNCLISKEILHLLFWVYNNGVDWIAACCMTFVNVSVASSRLSGFFSLICRFILLVISYLNLFQLVVSHVWTFFSVSRQNVAFMVTASRNFFRCMSYESFLVEEESVVIK